MAELADPQIERGRRLGLLVVIVTFGYEALSMLYYAIATVPPSCWRRRVCTPFKWHKEDSRRLPRKVPAAL